MTALLAYMEFQFEACFQILLQTYISDFYITGIRAVSTNQIISLTQSYATIIITVTNVWIPQLVGTRQYVPTLKTKVWQFALNIMLFFTLLNTVQFSGLTRNHYFHIFVVVLYAGMCSTLLLHNNVCKKFKHTNRLKSCLLTFLFLIKIAFTSLSMYVPPISDFFEYPNIPFLISLFIQTLFTICMDAFFVYIFGKSALNTYSSSSIWNNDPAIISKPLFYTSIFLASFQILLLLLFIMIALVYNYY